jgi:hypothetical protein
MARGSGRLNVSQGWRRASDIAKERAYPDLEFEIGHSTLGSSGLINRQDHLGFVVNDVREHSDSLRRAVRIAKKTWCGIVDKVGSGSHVKEDRTSISRDLCK